MYHVYSLKLILAAIVSAEGLAEAAKDIYGLQGGTVTFVCPFKGENGKEFMWAKLYNLTTLTLSINERINNQTLEPELYKRLAVVGDYKNREYILQISYIRESDEGMYRCNVGTQQQDVQTLYMTVPPTSVKIQNVMLQNRLLGTEEQDLTVLCVAVGGKPSPSVTLKIDGPTLATGNQLVTYTLMSISRSFDRKTITCQASNEANIENPVNDSSTFYLNLKPLQPTFGLDPVSTEEGKALVVSCTSTGSRPQATFQWKIGLANVTSNSIAQSTVNPADDTYTVTSTLTYIVDRTYNKQTVTCGAYNNVSTSGVNADATLDVKFAPAITVPNVTYGESTVTRKLTCTPFGNPTTYAYYRWQHKSTYGVLIRELDGGQDGVLTLPSVPVEDRYQDSGEYVCTAGNGITGRDGKIQQTGSGYVIFNAQPVFTSGNNDTKYGELRKKVDIHVYVYSFPKYTSLRWYKHNMQILQTDKYTLFESKAIVNNTFHGIMVQLDGYRVTLTIHNLMESDFNVSYGVELSNDLGQPVEYTVLLLSSSAPETPVNFTALSSSESSIAVQWEAGYNGGHDQTFFVEYRVFGSVTWIAMTIPDTKQTGTQTYTLTGLQDGTLYELRMYAKNNLDQSLPTKTEQIKTIKAASQSSASVGPIIGGVAGGLLGALIILVVLWFMIFKRKQDTSSSSKASRSRSDSEVPEGLQHNILYQSADFKPLVPKVELAKKEQNPSTPDTEYAEVQKPNAVYAEVDKTVQQKNLQDKNKKDKKKKPKKPGKKLHTGNAGNNNQDDEYANAGMSLKDMGEGEYANAKDRNGPPTSNKNQQGLEYADLSFTKPILQKGKKPVIHGEEDRTVYSEVDHSKKAPPPPQESAYEETNFKHG